MKAMLTQTYVLKGVFVLIIGAALGLGGPYGTFELLPLMPRLVFWMAVLFVPWVLWEGLFFVTSKFVPDEINPRLLMVLLMPVFAVIGSAFVTALSIQIDYVEAGSFLNAWPMSILTWLIFSGLIILPLILIGDELSRRQRRVGGSELLFFLTEKLPEKLRGAQLIALKSEDHYLRVYTSAGNDLILMSMQNAMTALSGYPGVRTHRSWWVALDQFPPLGETKKLTSDVELLSGLKVPVSRRKVKLVISALETRSGK